jgi:hypothetical protein
MGRSSSDTRSGKRQAAPATEGEAARAIRPKHPACGLNPSQPRAQGVSLLATLEILLKDRALIELRTVEVLLLNQ